MKKNLTYRIASLAFALGFCLFNVGIPVIIATCPMMSAGKSDAKCCVTGREVGSSELQTPSSANCCKTIFLADRNTTEFLQSNLQSITFIQLSPIMIPLVAGSCAGGTVRPILHISNDTSPPFSHDIPLAVSSLLI